jgi:hypothetical protein
MEDVSKKPYPGKILREPTTEWECEVIDLVLPGEDEETAVARVIQKWLNAADPRALIDAHRKGYRFPPMLVRFIAAMFNEDPSRITNEPVLTYFLIERRERTVTDEARRRREWIEAGKAALDNNQDPGWMFWHVLVRALCVGHPNAQAAHLPLPDIPIKVTIRCRDKRHRPAKPDLATNRRILRETVERLVKGPERMTATAAIQRVAAENNKSFETVRAAYYGDASVAVDMPHFSRPK